MVGFDGVQLPKLTIQGNILFSYCVGGVNERLSQTYHIVT